MKMSITGLSAQAKGQTPAKSFKVLLQGGFIALVLAICLLIVNQLVLKLGLHFSKAQADVAISIVDYFSVRIWGAPAALINMVMIGWLIGQQKTKSVLMLQVIINLANIVASLVFVFVFDWGVQGVAAATVFAEYLMLAIAIYLVNIWRIGQSDLSSTFNERDKTGQSDSPAFTKRYFASVISFSLLRPLIALNSHMLVRNLALQFTLAFITLKGAQFGAQAAAVNAIILQFFTLIALGLDGVANAVEALIGEAKGKQDLQNVNQQVKIGLFWSSILAIAYSLVFYFLDSPIVNLLTHHDEIVEAMHAYALIVYLLPLIAHWCFLFDGVYVGLSKGKPMRNSMLLSTGVVFLPVWWLAAGFDNMGLWFAMLAFLLSRGMLLGIHYGYLYKKKPKTLLE